MKKHQNHADVSRRAFLRGTVATGAGAAVAATVPGVAVASTAEGHEEDSKRQKGYRLSQHIVDYYKTTAS